MKFPSLAHVGPKLKGNEVSFYSPRAICGDHNLIWDLNQDKISLFYMIPTLKAQLERYDHTNPIDEQQYKYTNVYENCF